MVRLMCSTQNMMIKINGINDKKVVRLAPNILPCIVANDLRLCLISNSINFKSIKMVFMKYNSHNKVHICNEILRICCFSRLTVESYICNDGIKSSTTNINTGAQIISEYTALSNTKTFRHCVIYKYKIANNARKNPK